MTNADATTIVKMLGDVIVSRGGESIFDGDVPTDLGLAWIFTVERLQDAAAATQAVAALFAEGGDRLPTPADLEAAYRKLTGQAADEEVEEEDDFVRPLDTWVKGWVLARVRGDMRLWPEQKDGYDRLQIQNPYTPAYVWGEQGEVMPDEDRAKYEAAADKMAAAHFDSLLTTVVGGRPR